MPDYNDIEEKFVTAAQAAEILGVSVSTLKKFILQGKLRVVKTPGGHYRVPIKDMLEDLCQYVGGPEVTAKGAK